MWNHYVVSLLQTSENNCLVHFHFRRLPDVVLVGFADSGVDFLVERATVGYSTIEVLQVIHSLQLFPQLRSKG